MSYPSDSAGNVSELSTTSTIIPKSKKQKCQNTYQSECSIGDVSDISTSTVIPEPKPDTREWIQRHHRLSEEIVEDESYENCMHQIKNDEYEIETHEPYTNIRMSSIPSPDFIKDMVEKLLACFDDYRWHVAEFAEEKINVTNYKKRFNRENTFSVFISPVSQIHHESNSGENKTVSSRIAPNSHKKTQAFHKATQNA